jgi:hypothetical protein
MRVLLIEEDSAVAQSIELMLKVDSFNVYTTDLGVARPVYVVVPLSSCQPLGGVTWPRISPPGLAWV